MLTFVVGKNSSKPDQTQTYGCYKREHCPFGRWISIFFLVTYTQHIHRNSYAYIAKLSIIQFYLASPYRCDNESIISEDIEYFNDPPWITKHRDTGIWYSQVKCKVVSGLQKMSLFIQDKNHDAISKPRHPTWKTNKQTTLCVNKSNVNKHQFKV